MKTSFFYQSLLVLLKPLYELLSSDINIIGSEGLDLVTFHMQCMEMGMGLATLRQQSTHLSLYFLFHSFYRVTEGYCYVKRITNNNLKSLFG